MKAECNILQYKIKILVCISITSVKSAEIIKALFNEKSNIFNPSNSKLDFREKNRESTNQEMKSNSEPDDCSNDIYNNPLIVKLQDWKGFEESEVLLRIFEIQLNDNCREIEDVSEKKSADFVEIPKDNKNLRITTNATFTQNAISHKKNSRISGDISKILSVIGSLEEPVKDSDNFASEIFGPGGKKTSSTNSKSKDKTELKDILPKVNIKLQNDEFAINKNTSIFINHININVINDTSKIKNILQTLTVKKNLNKSVRNPHLAEEKSYFMYKKDLEESSKLSENKN